MGHEVRCARDGLEAIALARDFAPDAILMDIGMPGIDGYEAARESRRLGLARTPTIVALTGWGPGRESPGSRESPFDAHLMKPVEPEAIVRLLAELPRQT